MRNIKIYKKHKNMLNNCNKTIFSKTERAPTRGYSSSVVQTVVRCRALSCRSEICRAICRALSCTVVQLHRSVVQSVVHCRALSCKSPVGSCGPLWPPALYFVYELVFACVFHEHFKITYKTKRNLYFSMTLTNKHIKSYKSKYFFDYTRKQQK